jgi:cytochrome bd-type quinol oxidase subunit 2
VNWPGVAEPDGAAPGSSRWGRLTANPANLRRRAWLLTGLVAVLGGIGYAAGDRTWARWVVALSWVAMPFLAVAIALAEAFFVRHGRGGRRLALTALAGGLAALGACGALAASGEIADSLSSNVSQATVYALLFVALVGLISALLALGIGRGETYLSRKIQAVDDDGW